MTMAIKEIKREWSPCQLGYVKTFLLHTEEDVNHMPPCSVGSMATVAETDNEYVKTNDGWKLLCDCDEDGGTGAGGGGVTSWNDLTDRPFYEGVVDTVLYDEQDVDFSAGSILVFQYDAVPIGDNCTVTVDGTAYELTCVLEILSEELGISRRVVAPEDGSFAIYEGYMQFTDKGTHSVKITITKEGVKTLDEKYFPASVVEKLATVDSKMGMDNPTGNGALSIGRKKETKMGACSSAVGDDVEASGLTSHAEGCATTASGVSSHAEGYNTTASGYYSHAEGYNTTASGYYSHAEGYRTKASKPNQHVQGKCNIEDTAGKYAHIVGNGTDDDSRSNAHTLDWDGNAWFAGTMEGTAMLLKSSTEGSTKRFRITVDDEGTLTAQEITE